MYYNIMKHVVPKKTAAKSAKSSKSYKPVKSYKSRRKYKSRPIVRTLYFPERAYAKLKYCDVFVATIAGSGTLINPMNYYASLVDPKLAGSPYTNTHQPLAFDQYMALYDGFRVFGIKYHFTIINHTINETWFAAVERENENADLTSLQTLMERRNNASVKVGGQQYSRYNRVVIKGYLSQSKTLGVSRGDLQDSQFRGTASGSPGRYSRLALYMSQNNSVSQSFDVIARLTYYCQFDTRRMLQAS